MLRAAQDCEAIAHLAAIPDPMRGVDQLTQINVCGTQYILEAAESNSIERVVLASSAAIYGMVFAAHAVDEPSAANLAEIHGWIRKSKVRALAAHQPSTRDEPHCPHSAASFLP